MEMLAKGKKALLLFATDSEEIDIRYAFSESLDKAMGRKGIQYPSCFSFFEAIDDCFGDEHGLLANDEYPNLVLTRDGKRKKSDFYIPFKSNRHVVFKKMYFDSYWKQRFIHIIIADNRSLLYHRPAFSLSSREFELDGALLALKDIPDDWEKAKNLAWTNTFPYYLSLIDTSKTFDENLNRLFYGQDAIIVDDPSIIITSEKADGGLYASLIRAISLGYDTLERRSTYLKTDSSKVA